MSKFTNSKSLTMSVQLLFLLLLLPITDVGGRRQYSGNNNRQHRGAPGPNMCKVQHVLGTRDRFFTHCVAKHLKMICERPTYDRWECCSGFKKKGRTPGCTEEKALDNIMETAAELKLRKFAKYAQETGLARDLDTYGPYTVFVPSDEALMDVSTQTESMLRPEDGSLSLLNYHIAPGKLNLSTFRHKNHELVTLHNGDRIRVNKYAYGVATVNCARIIRPDEMATNGIVHVIDKVINPLDVKGNLAEKIQSDGRYSQFQLALLVSDMAQKLKAKKKSFTVLAPTNEAFAKLPNDILYKILNDADTAEKVIKRHVVRGVFCADAIVVAVGLKTLDDTRLLFRCKRDGLMINEARVVDPDRVTSNGVVHGIDTVLLPDSIKTAEELMKDMYLDGFLELAKKAGLNGTFDRENITVFTPTDKAIAELSSDYMAALREEPLKMKKLLEHHIVKGRVGEEQLVGDTGLETTANLAVKIKVNVYREGVTLDKAKLEGHPRECKNAMIQKVDKVIIPSENSLMDLLMDDPDLSVFTDLMEKSGVTELLLPSGTYTMLAPTNKALSRLDQRQLQHIINNKIRLQRFVGRHIIARMVLKCNIPARGVYTIRSMQRDETHFAFDSRKRLHVNTHSRVTSDDIMASNGVLYKIDHVLPCSCERSLRTNSGLYIGSHRYRRRY